MKLQYIDEDEYFLEEKFVYFSERYSAYKTVPAGVYDGATGAADVAPRAWLVHDAICNNPRWDNGKPITAWQAATVLGDILKTEGRWFRSHTWRIATFLFGCKSSRKNGWF